MSRTITILAALLLCWGGQSAAAVEFVTIGTGGITGVYYPAGGAVAKIINDDRRALKMRASVESTGGSVYNINAVISGDLQLGLAQSDRQYQAFKGLGEWAGKPQTTLRAICSLHPEIVTLVATVDSGITSVAGLKGKRVNLGNPGSGNRGNALDVLTCFKLDVDKDLTAEGSKAIEGPRAMQDGRLDAFFYTVGHPAGAITESTTGGRPVIIVPIAGPELDAFLADKPYYAKATIPHTLYPQAKNDADIPSFGVTATLVASADMTDESAYKITKQIFTHLETLKTQHPALGRLTPASMLAGLSAPIHPGAAKYYKEAGLTK